uniref:Uncharacterized protein n=1 Tax=Romanomermis culicivorax TaxID=13658 RepID=A0A915KS46_ROMCU
MKTMRRSSVQKHCAKYEEISNLFLRRRLSRIGERERLRLLRLAPIGDRERREELFSLRGRGDRAAETAYATRTLSFSFYALLNVFLHYAVTDFEKFRKRRKNWNAV